MAARSFSLGARTTSEPTALASTDAGGPADDDARRARRQSAGAHHVRDRARRRALAGASRTLPLGALSRSRSGWRRYRRDGGMATVRARPLADMVALGNGGQRVAARDSL